MIGRAGVAGRGSVRGRTFAALVVTTIVATGCSSRVVTTADAPLVTPTSAPDAAAPSTRPTNDGLANAYDFAAAQPDGRTGYYFISPSKRWACAIIPREKVGCQASTGASIPIAGAPTAVPDALGETVAPNAIEVNRDTDPHFASLESPGYALTPGPAAVLPFNVRLIVAGFRCNVQEATGVSCLSELTGKGFTFSADGYTLQYTDLPA